MTEDKTLAERGPNCFQCRNFGVSWDPALPYTCRLMGFKSRALPAIEVLRADGVFCQGFAAKDLTSAPSPGGTRPQVLPQAHPAKQTLPSLNEAGDCLFSRYC